MSQSKAGTQLGKTKKFSKYRCVKCHSYLIPLTEEKMIMFNFTYEQREKVRKHGLTHFCLRCSRGYQRQENPISEKSENCPYCGEELGFLEHEGELTDILYCESCKKGFLAEEETLKKIRKYEEERKKLNPHSKAVRQVAPKKMKVEYER